MWKLWLTAKSFSQRPSNLVLISDPWVALQFDNAVAMVGMTIEGALSERVKVGGEKDYKWEPKYKLEQLLADDFRLPPEKTQDEIEAENFQKFMGIGGVKVIKANK